MLPRLLFLALAGTSAVLIAGCGGGSGTATTTAAAAPDGAVTASTAATTTPTDAAPPTAADPEPQAEPPGADGAAGNDAARQRAAIAAQASYRDYIDAINARDGATLCALLAPASINELRAPVKRATCVATLTASIGYNDPRGFPVWRRTHLNAIDRTQVSADLDSARITAAIVTEFADRDEPSVESDIAYLEWAGGGWRLAKPSGALYRAVGNAEPPPNVIVPPPG